MPKIELEYLDTILVRPASGKLIIYLADKDSKYKVGYELDTDEDLDVVGIERKYEGIWYREGYAPPEFKGFLTAMHGDDFRKKCT